MSNTGVVEAVHDLNPSQVFEALESRNLFFAGNSKNVPAFNRLMQGLITREPKNLTRHVQYIYGLLANSPDNSNAILSALLDVFIILESSGLDLRKRLLVLAKPYLPQVDFDFLSHRLISGINRTTRLPSKYYSMLSASYTGHLEFISKKESESAAFASAYDEALSLLEYGDLEQAQGLLEQALKEKPKDATIANELLAVYKHNNDQKALEEQTQWFIANDLDLPENWPLL